MSEPIIYGNLSNQFPDSSLFTGQIELKNSINTLNTNLDTIQNKSSTFLANQDEVLNIVNQEKNRLEQKRQSIDNAHSSQVRSTQLNDSINKRYKAYLKILYVFIIVLVITLIIHFIGKYFPIIPAFILTFIYIGLFSFAIIYSISLYFEIQRHEKIIYDRLDNGRMEASGNLVDTSNNLMGVKDASGAVVGNCAEIDPITGNCIRLLETFSTYEYTHYSQY